MTGQVHAVASGKGGVGKTTTVINLGVALRMNDRTVALVDGDLGMPNLGALFGVEDQPTIHELLAGEVSLDAAALEIADGFCVLPGDPTLEGFSAADPDRLAEVVAELADRYDHVIVDTGAGLSYEALLPVGLADEVLLVTAPNDAAVIDTRKTGSFASMLGTPVRGAVVTRATPDVDVDDLAERLDTEVLAVVPDDPAVEESLRAGEPLASFAPDSGAAEAYRRLAAVLLGESVPDPAEWLDGGLGAGADDLPEGEDGSEGAAAADTDADVDEGTPDTDEDATAARESDATADTGGGVFARIARLFR